MTRAHPILSVNVDAWECPCGTQPAKPGRATPVRTLVSLKRPKCPFCGCEYRDEYRVRARNTTTITTPRRSGRKESRHDRLA